MTSMKVYLSNGRALDLGPAVKSGGEGELRMIRGDTARCAKIYHAPRRTGEAEAKVQAMVANPPSDPTWGAMGHRSIAWPTDLLYEDSSRKRFAGFTMPFLDMGEFRESQFYCSTADRVKTFGGSYTWQHQLTSAMNIASAVAAIHAKGHRVGDLRETNVLVSSRAPVTFIDCDSFEIWDSAHRRRHYCRVGTADWLPPELLRGTNFAKQDIERLHSDLFALGIMIFRFLMQGVHPFQARGSGVRGAPAPDQKILLGKFPYGGRHSDVHPPKFAPPFEIVPPDLRKLFERCFVSGHGKPTERPSAEAWFRALRQEFGRLQHCHVNRHHRYGGHESACPWCRLVASGKPDLYPGPPRSSAAAPGLGGQVALTAPVPGGSSPESILLALIGVALADMILTPDEERQVLKQARLLGISDVRAQQLLRDQMRSTGSRTATKPAAVRTPASPVKPAAPAPRPAPAPPRAAGPNPTSFRRWLVVLGMLLGAGVGLLLAGSETWRFGSRILPDTLAVLGGTWLLIRSWRNAQVLPGSAAGAVFWTAVLGGLLLLALRSWVLPAYLLVGAVLAHALLPDLLSDSLRRHYLLRNWRMVGVVALAILSFSGLVLVSPQVIAAFSTADVFRSRAPEKAEKLVPAKQVPRENANAAEEYRKAESAKWAEVPAEEKAAEAEVSAADPAGSPAGGVVSAKPAAGSRDGVKESAASQPEPERTVAVDERGMVSIPAGTYGVGARPDDIQSMIDICLDGPVESSCSRSMFSDQVGRHTVQLSGFSMDETEVSRGDYAECVRGGPCKAPGGKDDGLNNRSLPVVNVTWEDANTYCRWRGKRLPSEAEWEYAARRGHAVRYPWGDAPLTPVRAAYCSGPCRDRHYVVGFDGSVPKGGFPVRSHPEGRSMDGLYNLSGNVWEWTADGYRGDLYSRFEKKGQVRDPKERPGSATSARIIKGGSWLETPIFLDTRFRRARGGEKRSVDLGFRCVSDDRVNGKFSVPGGTLERGITEAEVDALLAECMEDEILKKCSYSTRFADQRPRHEVTLSSFAIDRAPVTNRQYMGCLKAGKCRKPGSTKKRGFDSPDQPVTFVSWDDAEVYCSFEGKRLCTEHEWEVAATGGREGYLYPWGGGRVDATKAYACVGECVRTPAKMRKQDDSFRPGSVLTREQNESPLGVRDMSGNVGQWTSDRYLHNAYGKCRKGCKDPHHPVRKKKEDIVVRGGSFLDGPTKLMSTYRAYRVRTLRSKTVGVRCCSDGAR